MIQPRGGSRRPSGPELIAGLLILVLAVATVVGAATVFQLPHAITAEGKRTTNLYEATLAISFIVFFGVTAGIIWAIFRYRRRSADEMPVQIHGSNVLELTWTIIPVIALVALFVPSLILVLNLKTPPDQPDLTVNAVGHQWWWEFDYPDAGITVQATPPNYDNLAPPHLVVPVGKTVLIYVRSTDVVHSFYAPHLLYKIQAEPGNINEMHFKAEDIGTYTGQCYQFCGLHHSDMRWVLDVVSQADYDKWLAQQKSAQSAVSPSDQAASAVSVSVSKN